MEKISIRSSSSNQFINITQEVSNFVRNSGIKEGLCIVYSPHTTGGITINEAADPDVVYDIIKELKKVIPDHDNYRHGEGNSSAHIKCSLMGASVQIPVTGGNLALGTWQGVFFCEFDGPRNRSVFIQIIGKQE